MAFTFDPSVGTATSNSYVSVADADDYFAAHLDGTDYWTPLSTTQKQAVLVQATNRIDRERFGGQKTHYGIQRLQWPRNAIVDRNYQADSTYAPTFENTGFYYRDPLSIPMELKQATCEQALYLLKYKQGDAATVEDYDLETLEGYKIGPLDMKIKAGVKADRLQTTVKELIQAIGPNAWTGANGIRFYA